MTPQLKTLLWIGGVVVAISVVVRLVKSARWRRVVRENHRRRFEEWTALAQSRGFGIGLERDDVVIRGTVASRPFVVNSRTCFTYGLDSENALNFTVEDKEAIFSVKTWDSGFPHGLMQSPVGDEAFDARYFVRANTEGMRYVARLGPDERRLLLRTSELSLLMAGGGVSIRLPYRLDLAHLDEACALVTRFWGPPSVDPRG